MKTRLCISRLCFRLTACLCAALWLASCASQRVDWAARVGHYTYDQAVMEMGPPDRQAKLADGSIVAEWLVNRGTTYIYGSPGFHGHYYAGSASAYTTPSRFMRLTFGPNGQLAAWTKAYK